MKKSIISLVFLSLLFTGCTTRKYTVRLTFCDHRPDRISVFRSETEPRIFEDGFVFYGDRRYVNVCDFEILDSEKL